MDIHEKLNIEPSGFLKIFQEVREKGGYSFNFERERHNEIMYFQSRVSPIHAPMETDLLGYVFMVQDITVQKRAEENMRFMAYHDILTRLPNRAAFNERLELELVRAQRNNKKFGITFYPDHGTTVGQLSERADQAMYAAKQLGHKNGSSNLKVFQNDQSYMVK